MSSLQKKMVFFGQWNPDGVEFDSPDLETSENVIPVYGAHRPLNKLREISNEADSDPITGGYAHLVSSAAPQQHITPLGAPETYSDADATGWFDDEGTDLHTLDDEGAIRLSGFSGDDESFVFTNDCDGTNPSNWKVWLLNTPRVTPSSFNEPVKITIRAKYKNPTGTTTPIVELWLADDTDDLVGSEASPRSVEITKAAGADEFEELSYTLDGTEETALLNADWTTLELGLRGDIADLLSDGDMQNPDADLLTTGWLVDGDTPVDEDNIYPNLARTHAGGNDYLDSYAYASIPKGASRTLIVEHTELITTWGNVGSIVPAFAFSSDKANTSFKVELLQVDASGADDPDAEAFVLYGELTYRIVYTWNEDNVSTTEESASSTHVTDAVLESALNEPNFNEKFYLAFTPTYAGDGSTGGSTVILYPSGPDPIAISGLTGDATDLADDNDQGITWTNGSHREMVVDIATEEDPSVNAGRVLIIKGTAGEDIGIQLRGINPNTGLEENIKQWTNPSQQQSFDSDGVWTATFGGRFLAHDTVKLHVMMGQGTSSAGAQVLFASYQYQGDSAKPKVYGAAFGQAQPVGRGVAISHAYLDAETDVNLNQVDRVESYVGTKTSLYLLGSQDWVDATRNADAYGDDSLATSRVWDFTSWGDDIIAVNYADEPQRLVVGTSKFVDLISSGIIPMARFCAVVGAQLILADINPVASADGDAYTDGKPYSIWASGILDPTSFKAADYDTQSAIFSLIAQPGGITGLIGGEYGIIFKRNSIWRMSYVGLPVVFKFDTISIGQGTPFPQSLVQVDSDVYFWGNGGIFRVNQGQSIQRLSGGRVEKLIFDTRFEPYALQSDYSPDTVINESMVQGAYDSYTGLVWWFYKGPLDLDHKLSHFIVYNPREDRFSHGQIDDLNVAVVMGKSNVSFKELGVNRGLEVMTYDGTNAGYAKFNDAETNTATLTTKIISPRSFDYQDGRDIEIHAARPIFRSQPASSNPPNFAIQVESAQDPNMYRGLQTQTVDHRRVDRDGWLHLNRLTVGEFHRLTVKFPSVNEIQVKEFLGVQLQIRAAGDY